MFLIVASDTKHCIVQILIQSLSEYKSLTLIIINKFLINFDTLYFTRDENNEAEDFLNTGGLPCQG